MTRPMKTQLRLKSRLHPDSLRQNVSSNLLRDMYLAESQVLEIAQDLALDGFDVSTLAAYMPQ